MKQYGFNKATEITKKQINVIFAKTKRGELKVEKWFMTELYNLADYYGYDDNRSVENEEREVKKILEAVFAGDLETAQKRIDDEQNHLYGLFGEKTKKSIDRSLMA